jgi:hypothetical protein
VKKAFGQLFLLLVMLFVLPQYAPAQNAHTHGLRSRGYVRSTTVARHLSVRSKRTKIAAFFVLAGGLMAVLL